MRLSGLVLVSLCLIVGCTRASRYAEFEVVASDFAFIAPDTVPPGETAVSLVNHGTVMHEVKVIGLRTGADLARVLPLAMADSAWEEFRDPTSGILTARAGLRTPGRLLIDFQAGRTYLLLCTLAQSDTSRLHSELGMVRVLAVR